MALWYTNQAVANGLHTDHPIPELPFVDDSILPLDDPAAIEAIGRKHEDGTWGRTDRCSDGGWVAFTTDQRNRDLAWLVRWHPEHGRSVVLYKDSDAASAYMSYLDNVQLYRAGAYWWDGSDWHRPGQIFNQSSGEYVDRPVPAALTVSAADLLEGSGADASRGVVLSVEKFKPGANPYSRGDRRWRDDLALWADRYDGGRHLAACVVQLAAPELTADQLLGAGELAEVAGIAASTLRAYLARGESEVPLPQATVGGRAMWSRPVAEGWAERRRRSDSASTMAADDRDYGHLSIGVKALWDAFTKYFLIDLWERGDYRKRFALRWRNRTAVEDMATHLGWTVAASLDRIVPIPDLGSTIHDAVLWDFAHEQKMIEDGTSVFYTVSPPTARMLDWLIQHNPTQAQAVVAEIVGEATRILDIPAETTGSTLRHALAVDGKLGYDQYEEFMRLALPPEN